MKHFDITNKKFKHLTAIKRVDDYVSPKGYKRERWLFKCDCGNEVVKCKNLVTRGECCSCGCEKSKRTQNFNKKTKTKHGMRKTRLYRIWGGIKTRCLNKSDKAYKLYGKRGITVCDEWKNSFVSFMDWAMQNGYAENLTIDRIDVNGNYCPENCRWATMKEQGRNKRNNLVIELYGKEKCLSEWAEEYGFNDKKERFKIKKIRSI